MSNELKVQAVADKVIIRQMNLKEIKTSGGIIVPETAKPMIQPQVYGEVLSVGEEIETIEVGDIIMFHGNGGQAIVLDEFICRALAYGEIYGIASKKADIEGEIPDSEFMKITKKEENKIVTLDQ